MHRARGRLADQRRERSPGSYPKDDERLQRLNGVGVICAVCRKCFAHLLLKLTEDGPSVDHTCDIPFPRTKARFVEVLPYATSQDVFEVGVTVDRLLGQRRERETVRRFVQGPTGIATDEFRDA
jgi:hypothetical protein